MFLFVLSFLSLVLITFLTSYALEPKNVHDFVQSQSIAPIPSALLSNRYTQVDDLRVIETNPYASLDGYELLGIEPTNNLALYVNNSWLSLRIVNLDTGYVWASNMDYDYLDPDSPLYNPDDIGADYYLDPEYDRNRDAFVREDRSPVSITYYNTLQTTNQRTTEYLFENVLSGTIQRVSIPGKLGFKAMITMPISGIKFHMLVYLDSEGLHVEVPFETIQDNGNFILSTMTLYRYFGFTKQDYTPGYVFIPDGVGALIRYDSKNSSAFVKKFYGPDYTLNEVTPEERLTAAVWGLVQGVNQNAMLGIVASGAGNATFSYIPANNIQTNFNRAQVAFEFRNTYTQKLNASGTSTIERIQTQMNPFDIHLIYPFLDHDDANYVGLANQYRRYLMNKGEDFNKLIDTEKIPMYLDVLAAENRPVWYGRETFTMTTTNQLKDMVYELKEAGVGHLDINVLGWQKGGLGYTQPNYNNYEGKFGSPWDLYELEGTNVFFGMMPWYATRSGGGYNSGQVVQSQGQELIGNETFFLLKPEEALSIFQSNYHAMYKHGVRNVGLGDFGYILFSDYSNGIKSRSQNIETIRQFLNVAEMTVVEKPFDYLWSADVITDIPMYSSQQLKFTDTVPFIPIVLSG